MQYWIPKLTNSLDIYSQTTQSERRVALTACYSGKPQQQSTAKNLETPMHSPFPLQYWDMIAKLHGYNNIAKGREEMKGSRIFQSVSRFLSEVVACTNPKVISTSLKFFLISRIDNCSSVIKIPQKPSNHLPSGKWRSEFPSLKAKSTSPGLLDTTFFAHCYSTEAISEMEEIIAVLGKFSQ